MHENSPCEWQAILLPQRIFRKNLLPLTRPPKRLIIRKSQNLTGDITMSLSEFRVLVSALRRNKYANDRVQQKPTQISSLCATSRQSCCVSCGYNWQDTVSKIKSRNKCSNCGTQYVSCKSLSFTSTNYFDNVNSKEIAAYSSNDRKSVESRTFSRLQDYFYHTICVYEDKIYTPHSPRPEGDIEAKESMNGPFRAQLLVPPPNLYPGEIARRVLQTVEEVLSAILDEKPVFLDRTRQKILTDSSLKRRNTKVKTKCLTLKFSDRHTETKRVMPRKTKNGILVPKNCVILDNPQKATGYIRLMGSRFVDKCKFGKDNQIRRQILGRVINGCSRKTVGTSGSLPAGYAVLPSKVLRTLGEPKRRRPAALSRCFIGDTFRSNIRDDIGHLNNMSLKCINESIRGEGNSIRYPVIDKLNIAYAELVAGGDRWTADVPSSQFKYNGGDNDGDAFNFERFSNGLLANSAYENRLATAPAFNMSNNGQLKMEFDSDAKLGLGMTIVDNDDSNTRKSSNKAITSSFKKQQPRWKQEMMHLRTNYFITGYSFQAYKRFLELESFGRERSRFGGVFSLEDYARAVPNGALRRVIQTEAVSRLTMAHYMHSTRCLGKQQFPYNSMPVHDEIYSSLLNGLKPSDYATSCQATFDALANQKSSQMSLQGNLQYQFQYVMRPMVLAPNRCTVFNPVTRKTITKNVSSLYVLTNADAECLHLIKAALDFARIVIDLKPIFYHSECVYESLRSEAKQYKRILYNTNFSPKLSSFTA